MSPRSVGRYQIFEPFAAGGMASVHLGRMKGDAGFSRTVAIKQLHASFAEDAAIVSTILDEARLASRIQHPNVVSTLDVVMEGADILLVLEYVHGESLARLLRASTTPPPIAVANAVLAAALHGLHAAHEATSETGEPLGIVHRDVSPQNVLVGVDGLARVLDFGIAKARGRLQTTREGQVKGKLAYMAPEQIRLGEVGRVSDVFAAGIVYWEALTGQRLFAGDNEGHVMMKVLEAPIPSPSSIRPEVGAEIDAIVARALAREPSQRWARARDFAIAIESAGPVAPASAIGRWVEAAAHDSLAERAARVAAIERGGRDLAEKKTAARDERTETDVVEPEGNVTRTENRAISLPAPITQPKPGSPRMAFALAASVGLVAALGLAWKQPWRTPEPRATNAMVATSEPLPTTSTSSEAGTQAPPEVTSASSAASASASASGQSARPLAARPGGAAKPAPTATATAQPATSKPYYRFE